MLISCRYYLILVWSIVPISKALGTTLPLYSNFTLHLRPLTHTHMFQWVCNCLYMWIIASERAKRLRETSIKNINRAQLEIRVGAKFPRHNQPERERERVRANCGGRNYNNYNESTVRGQSQRSLEQPSLCSERESNWESTRATQCERGRIRIRMRTRTKADGDVGAVTDLGSTCPLSAFSTVVGGGCSRLGLSLCLARAHFSQCILCRVWYEIPEKTPYPTNNVKSLYNVFIIIFHGAKHRVKCIQNLCFLFCVCNERESE